MIYERDTVVNMNPRNKLMIAFRASERTRFGLRLIASARGYGSVSDAITFAIEEALRDPRVGVYDHASRETVTLERVIQMTWDEDEAARFLSLRRLFPKLLAPEELLIQARIASLEKEEGKHLDDDEIRRRWAELKPG
jgi:hypothetical protein